MLSADSVKLGSSCHHTPCSLLLQDLNKLASPGIVLHKDSVTLQSDLKGLDQVKNYYKVSAGVVWPEAQGAWEDELSCNDTDSALSPRSIETVLD